MSLTLRAIAVQEVRALYAQMKRDFPANERPPYFAFASSFQRGVYAAFYLCEEGEARAYAVVTPPEGSRFALLNFLAVLPEHRSKRYGSDFLRMLEERFADRAMLIEVEAPESAKSETDRGLRERRVAFYERAGFRVLPTERSKIFGVDMWIMTNGPETISARQAMHACYRAAFRSERWLKHIDVVDRGSGR